MNNDITLTIPVAPGSINSPTKEQIEEVLSSKVPNLGLVGEIWLVVRCKSDFSSYSKLSFYIDSAEELVAFYEDSIINRRLVSVGDRDRLGDFLAEDVGGKMWKLNSRFLVPVQKGIDWALKLLEEDRLEVDAENWEVMPEDF